MEIVTENKGNESKKCIEKVKEYKNIEDNIYCEYMSDRGNAMNLWVLGSFPQINRLSGCIEKVY